MENKKTTWKKVSYTIIVVIVLVGSLEVRDVFNFIGLKIPSFPMPYGGSTLDNLFAVLLVLLAALVLLPKKDRPAIGNSLGLRWNGFKGPVLTLIATVPCWIGFASQAHLADHINVTDLSFLSVIFPLAEEVVFRGFGFVLTRRKLNWHYAPAVLIQSAVFGWIHWLGAGGGGPIATQVFLITFLVR